MKYRHPYDETHIIDNTELQPDNNYNTGATLLMPFISDKGVDGKMVTLNDKSKALKEYGAPNIKKHGQALYQVMNWLDGGGVVQGIRITADDAAYSNMLVSAEVKTEQVQVTNSNNEPLYTDSEGSQTTEASGNTPITKQTAKVKLVKEHFSGLTSQEPSTLQQMMKSKNTNDGSTYKIPLFTIVVKGKGIYGDAYRLRLTPNHIADRESVYRNYSFELYLNDGGLQKVEDPLNVSLYPSALDEYRRSEFLDDIIKRNIYPVSLYSYEKAFDQITELLLPVLSVDYPGIKPEEIDFIFGYDKSGVPYTNLKVDDTEVSLTALEGIELSEGSDGAFAAGSSSRDEAIYQKYVKVYNGDVDKNMLNKKKYPAQVILDANFPLEVKKAMQVCRTKRNDSVLYLDAGIISTIPAAKAWRKSEMIVDDYSTVLYCQHFATHDEYTAKEIIVTIPYLLSMLIPKHFNLVGNHKPLAGANYPLRKDLIIEGSLKPFLIDDEDKDSFYVNKLNYLEEDVDNLIIGTQITSQSKTSELSNLNNVNVLYDMKRTIENVVPKFRYEFTEYDSDIANFTRIANQALQPYIDYKCKFANLSIGQTQYQKERKILQTKLAVGFKAFAERNYIIIEISR